MHGSDVNFDVFQIQALHETKQYVKIKPNPYTITITIRKKSN